MMPERAIEAFGAIQATPVVRPTRLDLWWLDRGLDVLYYIVSNGSVTQLIWQRRCQRSMWICWCLLL